MVDRWQIDSSSDGEDVNPAESKGKKPRSQSSSAYTAEQASGEVEMKGKSPRFAPPMEPLHLLEVKLQNLVLKDNFVPPPGITTPWWCTDCFVAAWIGPSPRRVVETPPLVAPLGGPPLLRCKFVLPIYGPVEEGQLCLELVRLEPLPRDPGTSTRVRVLGRARVELGAGRPGLRGAAFGLPLCVGSPSPAFVGSIVVSMELRGPMYFL